MSKLLLVDGNSNLYRAYYAIRGGLSAPDGTPTGATYGFLLQLHKLLEALEPSHVGVAFDVSRVTFRTEIDPEYKAHRKPMPDELRAQIPQVRRALVHLGIPILELEGFEADDVMATLARRAADEGVETVLATTDKDLMQVVANPLVRMWHTSRETLLDEAGVEEAFGVPPEQVPEVLALMGDSSDNIPGCKGIGEKGAKALVAAWGSVAAMLDNLDEVEPTRSRNALAKHIDDVQRSRRLVEIPTDLDVPLALDELERGGGDPEALADLYRELGFTSLLARLEMDAGESVEVRTVGLTEFLEAPGSLALDGHRCAVARNDEVVVAEADDEAATAEAVAAVLNDAWCVHGSKELLRWLRDHGVDWREAPRDTELAAYLLDPGEAVDLEDAARRALTVLPRVGDDASEAAAAAALTRGLAEEVFPRLDEEGLRAVYDDIDAPLVPILEAMERRGIRLDVGFLESMSETLAEELDTLEAEIYRVAGDTFNIASSQQLGEIMFERLDYPVLKRTSKTRRPSTSQEVLEELADRGFPLPRLILDHRERAKLKSTYVDALPAQVEADGRVHTRLHQTVAATGRLSSSDPNLQNIPVRTDMGRRIRRAFVADQGCRLVVADYSQIELRVLAHMSADPGLVEAFRAGRDIHAATAAVVLGVPVEEVGDADRRAAKTVNFGLMYGMGAHSLSRDLGISHGEAQRFIDTYFERFPKVRAFMESLKEQGREDGRVRTHFGRARRTPNLDHPNRAARAAAERMAINAPIQGTAADLIKLAMIELDRRLEEHPARLLLQVHDELVLEVPEAAVDSTVDLVREVMAGVAELDVPLVVDVGVGESWYDAK